MAVSRVKFAFNPFETTGVKVPKKNRDEALSAVADFVLEQVLSKVGETNSPVKGRGKFKSLSKDYRAIKRARRASPIPNLELTGAMLDALKSTPTGNRVILEIAGKQASKADGHNNHSGDSDLPLRRFIPSNAEKETFKRDILSGIRSILKEHQ